MQIDIITLFPEMFEGPFAESIIRRAQDKFLVKINIHDLRKWAIDKRGTVDDKPYGGGVGMILRPEPIFKAIKEIKKQKIFNNLTIEQSNNKTVLLSAGGIPYSQKKAKEFSCLDSLILICGHYEGVDQRVADYLVDEEISIGDYVLTGGEIPAMVIVDSVVRLIPDVLEKKEATKDESFSGNLQPTTYNLKPLLEYPQYTRPENYQGYKVPEVLLSGNHREIEKWREVKAVERTRKLRPDLLKKFVI